MQQQLRNHQLSKDPKALEKMKAAEIAKQKKLKE